MVLIKRKTTVTHVALISKASTGSEVSNIKYLGVYIDTKLRSRKMLNSEELII